MAEPQVSSLASSGSSAVFLTLWAPAESAAAAPAEGPAVADGSLGIGSLRRGE